MDAAPASLRLWCRCTTLAGVAVAAVVVAADRLAVAAVVVAAVRLARALGGELKGETSR
jgi:hypothetical protein